MNVGLIIPAAGSGSRMNKNKNKQYLQLERYPILVHTLKTFINSFNFKEIIAVVKKEEMEFCRKEILKKHNIKGVKLVAGGKTRRESVYFGLKAFSLAINYVIIHDGARPLITKDIINDIINNLNKYKAIITGVPVKDTIKIKDENEFSRETLNRDNLVAVQTPQAFLYDLIVKAHEKVPAEVKVSDDASLVEKIGHPVKIIRGSYENIKITTPDDLAQAKLILQRRNR
ncbi:MAG: 2-C-methyl-D-erythritol 4-phosphate cytidylyltransferase [Bacillota bacterium]